MLLCRHPDGVYECLYRTRNPERLTAALSAVRLAYERGQKEGRLGWPEQRQHVRMFEIEDRSVSLRRTISITERHSSISSFDRSLYETEVPIDGDMMLSAVRRAASIGALNQQGRDTRGRRR